MALIVAVEGLPGSGKTTAIKKIIKVLRSRGISAEKIDIETDSNTAILSRVVENYPPSHPIRILLSWALRLQQCEAIKKMMDNADMIFLDRFWGSALAIDIYGNNVPPEVLNWVGQYIRMQPDITLFFDAPLDLVRQRKESKTMQDPNFAQRIKTGYDTLASAMAWLRVDATQKPADIAKQCLVIVLAKLTEHEFLLKAQ